MNSRHYRAASLGRRTALALAISLGTVSGAVFAQSTSGRIFGQTAAGAGDSVTVTSDTGVSRTVNVGADGRYVVDQLPLGNYKVTLNKGGAAVDSRANVTLRVGAGTDVSFGGATAATADTSNLEGVTVSANALPSIDVSTVDSRTVITSEQLSKLPLARTAEAIALLAPGAVAGSSFFVGPTGNPLVSIAGSAVTENAYYINGFNTTDPLSGFGGITLPYGAIDQQEVLAGGYGAAYGRSSGGVISQVGKRGTNEWHFGGQVLWEPKGTKADPINYYSQIGANAGRIYDRNRDDKFWRTTYSAYAGGPLIKDTLYVFLAAEQERREGSVTTSTASPFVYKQTYTNPKYYAKVDWNITDSNILELTGASNKQNYDASIYDYDYATGQRGDFTGKDTAGAPQNKSGADVYSAKFTSYITDDLTLTALYGKMKGTYYTATADSTLPSILQANQQNTGLTGGGFITNSNPSAQIADPKHKSTNTNLRVDLSYHIGDHTITAGIDNQKVLDKNDGITTSGPGYAWEYWQTDAGTPIIGTSPTDAAYVAPPGGDGYYVARYVYSTQASVRTTQRAQYIEDAWQVSDRWLLKLGLRNDQFTNYNQNGQAYLRLTTPQWAPRLGATWDVNGDSSLKIYANAGRYFLALPASVALRSAGASLYTREYFTYTGINPDGTPTGLTPIFSSTGGPISANREYGIPRDPKTAAATNIKSQYQDEFILGFDAALTDKWTYGAKATVRKLRNAIDDVGDAGAIEAKMIRSGIDPDTIGDIQGSYLFNPGRANTFLVPNTNGGFYSVDMNNKDFGFPHSKRNYYGLELYLDHAWDGKYQVRFDYVYSKSYGNSEGQVRSDIRQDTVSATVDWDYAEVMQYANGELANSRKHQFKIYGSYQLAPEWLVSANANIASGAPKSCLGFYGPGQTNPNLGYGSYYHWCEGQPSPPGEAGHNPWTYIVTGSIEYRPTWADSKLGFNLTVFNLFDSRKETQIYPIRGSTAKPNPRYGVPLYQTTPRYARVGITYDF
ncbi:TonB-dependent receptor [Luteibacter sp. UNCMF366Tsu5.1]|uniref:TonB-dependent receptor n=1 Tax=Luteibacter sp. UNCMF366Tsu5.1 TaxID=1502758 RepID=UPI000908F377|nr:TonB-dependent receptor [Luteibacter sp. UNCMF366Tsu5.1]SFW76109.1 TonB-dependent Receptor Plug Domain [Luteibacter sp. UNCMF366Tsu5.1]